MIFNRFSCLKTLFSLSEHFNLRYASQLESKARLIHTTLSYHKLDDRRGRQFVITKQDQGTDGESSVNIDNIIQSRSDMFPTENTPNMLFNGIPFSKIPICNIKVSKNNTIISLNDGPTGDPKAFRSCGMEGFKNTRKGTNIAAQATAITFGTNIKKLGFGTIRVRIQGLGPGRLSAIKGLEMAGLNIISITDNTPVSWYPPRPRKQRRL